MKKPSYGGQGIIEFLVIVGAVIAAVLFAGPISNGFIQLFGESAGSLQHTAMQVAQLPPWADQRDQTPPEEEEAPEDKDKTDTDTPGDIAGLPTTTPPFSTPGMGGRGGGGGGGGGGGSGSVSGSGGSPAPPAASHPAPPTRIGPNVQATTPTTPQQSSLDAAKALLLSSGVTFSLFDFVTGTTVTHTIAEAVNAITANNVPILVGNLLHTIGALAAVEFFPSADGTVDFTQPIRFIFDQTFLAGATVEAIAAVFAHEAWHVYQVFSRIMDDFTNYPRIVDIEYEAFVVGAAAWNALKGAQTNPTQDLGAACIAAGEARCKEILVADFGYPPGFR